MASRPVYLAALRLEGRPVLVVGGGRVARHKVEGLLAAGASVTLVAPEVAPELRSLPIRIEQRPFSPGDLDGQWLVITATGRPEVDRAVFAAGELDHRFVNAADDPEGCSFYLPAVARLGTVSVGVSTGGASPALAGVLRDRVASALGDEVTLVAELLADARAALHAAGRSTEGLDWRRLAGSLLDGASGQRAFDELAAEVDAFVAAALAGVERRSWAPDADE